MRRSPPSRRSDEHGQATVELAIGFPVVLVGVLLVLQLALVGREDVPVAVGAAGPMRGEVALGNYVHGVSGLDGPVLPEPTVTPVHR